jgi:hypothetical protein
MATRLESRSSGELPNDGGNDNGCDEYDDRNDSGDDGDGGDDCFDTPVPALDDSITTTAGTVESLQSSFRPGGVVIVCCGNVCQVLTDFLILKLKLTNVGKVSGNRSGASYSAVWTNAAEEPLSVLLLVVNQKFPEQLVHQWVRLFAGAVASSSSIICLGGIPSSSLVSEADILSSRSRSHIRHLCTTAFKNLISSNHETDAFQALQKSSSELGTGNVLTGLLAAVMCFAEVRNIKALVCLTVTASSTAFTVESAAALERVIPVLNAVLSKSGGSLLVNGEDCRHLFDARVYQALAKRDSFAVDTSNLYI